MRFTKNSCVRAAHVDVHELVGHVVREVREDAVAEVLEEGVLHRRALQVEHGARDVVDQARDRHLPVRPDGVQAVDVHAVQDLLETPHRRQRVQHTRDEIAGLNLVYYLEVWILLVPLAVQEDW